MCIKLHFYLFFVVIYFYAIHKLNLFLIFYGFTILHEMAHILMALILKVKIKEVFMLPVGVCAKYSYIHQKRKEIIIAAVGPLFSIIMAIFLKAFRDINLSIAFLNLIPIYPLDGGRILRGILEFIFGYKRGVLFSNYIAKILLIVLTIAGVLLMVYFKKFSLFFLDVYIFFIIKEEIKKDRIRKIINALIEE